MGTTIDAPGTSSGTAATVTTLGSGATTAGIESSGSEATTASSFGSTSTGEPLPPPPEGGLGPWGFGFIEPEGVEAIWIGVDDFDGDGHLDLFAKESNAVGVAFLGDGEGGFARGEEVELPNRADLVRTGDFDGDGDVDVAVFDEYSDQRFHVLYNDGAGTFAPPVAVPLEGFYGFGVIPFRYDGDAAMDLFIPQGHSEESVVASGNASGFAEVTTVETIGCYFSATAVADLDDDGLDDVVGTGSCNSGPSGLWLATYGRSSGTFVQDQVFSAGPSPSVESADVVVADLDGDGRPDVVTPAQDGGLYALLNEGGGVLEDPPRLLDHDWEGYPRRLVELRVDQRPAFVIEDYYWDAPPAPALLRATDDTWSGLETDPLELQGVVAGTGDVNEDGEPDLLVLGFENRRLAVWLSGAN